MGSLRYALAGLSSGFVSCLALHPLDVVNTRFQAYDGKRGDIPKYRNTGHALATILRNDGLVALYSGLAPNLIGQTVSWGCFFFTHAHLKALARDRKYDQYVQGGDGIFKPRLSFGERFACSAAAGMLTATVTQPIWVIKTRLQLQTANSRHYSGVLDVALRIRQEEGWRGLWRGLLPSLCLVSNIAIQMFIYEELVSKLRKYAKSESVAGWSTFVCGAAAKVCASSATYPLMLVRTRLQQRDPTPLQAPGPSPARRPRYYSGVADVVRKTFVGEGVLGFYKGLGTNLVRVVPGAAITFSVYEFVKNKL